jgi:hypothetical protein
LLVAVADGAGSAERSDQAARCAVEGALAALEGALAAGMPQSDAEWEGLLAQAFDQARQAVLGMAEAEELAPRAFATTLTCAVATATCLTVGQIGDGVVVAQSEDGQLLAATQPQRGEYANETLFLTMPDALQAVVCRVYAQPVTGLAIMTDGLIRLALNMARNEPHASFFGPLLAFTMQADDLTQAGKQLAAFLASERVCARTDDDKTLVLVVHMSDSQPDNGADVAPSATADGGSPPTERDAQT